MKDLYLFSESDLELLKARIEQLAKRVRSLGEEAGEACQQGETTHDNPAHDMAQGEKAVQSTLLLSLREILSQAQLVSESPSPGGPIAFGSVFELLDLSPDSEPAGVWYKVGSYWTPTPETLPEGDFEDDPIVLSYGSPIAQAVLGHQLNDQVQVQIGGAKKYFVVTDVP